MFTHSFFAGPHNCCSEYPPPWSFRRCGSRSAVAGPPTQSSWPVVAVSPLCTFQCSFSCEPAGKNITRMKYFSFITKEVFVQEEFQPFLEESCRWPGSMTSNAGEFPTGTNKLPESPPSVEQAVESLEEKISKTYFPNQMGIFNRVIFQKKKKENTAHLHPPVAGVGRWWHRAAPAQQFATISQWTVWPWDQPHGACSFSIRFFVFRSSRDGPFRLAGAWMIPVGFLESQRQSARSRVFLKHIQLRIHTRRLQKRQKRNEKDVGHFSVLIYQKTLKKCQINQSIDQTRIDLIKQSSNQSTDLEVTWSINQSINQSISYSGEKITRGKAIISMSTSLTTELVGVAGWLSAATAVQVLERPSVEFSIREEW